LAYQARRRRQRFEHVGCLVGAAANQQVHSVLVAMRDRGVILPMGHAKVSRQTYRQVMAAD
jgi:hypothetical protein